MMVYAEEFPLDGDLYYLNHAAVGVWPRRTRDAVQAFAEENMRRGAASYPEWMRVERSLRSRLVRLIGASSVDDIALCKNTSEALSLIAYGLEWRPGDNVVISDQEFPSNRMVWESLAHKGVQLRQINISGPDPEASLLAACDQHTRLLSISSVQYGTGLRMNLPILGEACARLGVLFCVDAIQSLGALSFDVEACQADFVVADAHKWMLGPEGIALFYSRPNARDQLKLIQYGWHMVEMPGDFDAESWQPSHTARCFEPGSPNTLGIHALDASLSLFDELGMASVEAQLMQISKELIEWVKADETLELITSSDASRHAGIVTFRVRGLDSKAHHGLYASLMAQGVICACRAGGIRFSPHFYTQLSGLSERWQQVVYSL